MADGAYGDRSIGIESEWILQSASSVVIPHRPAAPQTCAYLPELSGAVRRHVTAPIPPV
ncbi:MAG TPA: hypothetical protein VKT21_07505 [Thermoplasmata archaeon]|nr:hypothetical protein [Thermoplasmata archaeon]